MGKGEKKGILEKRLLTYSAAAAGVLALAPAADAAVKYSGIKNLVVNSGDPTVQIDLNFDGVNDLSFRYVASGYYGVPAIYIYPMNFANGSSFSVIRNLAHNDPVPLQCNYLIKGTLNNPSFYWGWQYYGPVAYDTLAGNFATAGNFNGAKGSIGVRFKTPGGTKYAMDTV